MPNNPSPYWPERVELQDDRAPSEWILPLLLPSFLTKAVGTPVGAIVPTGYAAYVRVLHPSRIHHRAATWQEVSASTGRAYHPLMQWEQIRPRKNAVQWDNMWAIVTTPEDFDDPSAGQLIPEVCDALYSTLAEWTSTPETSWLGIWDGYGQLHAGSSTVMTAVRGELSPRDMERERERIQAEYAASRRPMLEAVQRARTFHHPARDYFLAKSACSAICDLVRYPVGLSPNLAWPDDRAWCVGSEIDFDSTLVACSEECAADLLANERVEALRVQVEDRLDSQGDVVNPPPL